MQAILLRRVVLRTANGDKQPHIAGGRDASLALETRCNYCLLNDGCNCTTVTHAGTDCYTSQVVSHHARLVGAKRTRAGKG
jgi:hypothetical protein